jgi:hypothetical protein
MISKHIPVYLALQINIEKKKKNTLRSFITEYKKKEKILTDLED